MEKKAIFITAAVTSNKSPEENLGLGYLTKICRDKGLDITLIDGWLQEKNEDEIEKEALKVESPIFIGFSCNLLNGDAAIRIAKKLKEKLKSSIFIAGGFGPTLNPMKYLKVFDYVSLGEGEGTFSEICETLLEKKEMNLRNIPGIGYITENGEFSYVKRRVIDNLDELPFPERDTIFEVINNKVPVNISTSRGCMGNCLFCSIAAFWRTGCGSKWRGRSVKSVVDEIEKVYMLGAEYIKFVDDSFIEDSRDAEWCKEFADELILRNIKIRFRITMRADRITDEYFTIM